MHNLYLFPELEPNPQPQRPPADTSIIVVSFSGGKDSVATLLLALEQYPGQVIAHHQIILEDWPGTVEYCQATCKRLGVQLHMSQGIYHGYQCELCQERYLTSLPIGHCRKCKSQERQQLLTIVDSVLDLVEWRQAWPSLAIRFCTSYFKRDNFNKWVREHRELLGTRPVVAMGERWRESRGRAKLPTLRERSKLEYMLEWRPVLDYRRIEIFRKMRDYSIEPHYCYQAQGMTEHQMYEEDQEGGPRMSCVMCFLKTDAQMQASYQAPEGRAIIERGIAIEQQTGHTIKMGRSLLNMIS
jgi:3'-phosphoadenosine 5'-phosphosulfate sulfotransferase (PAPS reductase)/FAD synthetase